MWNGWSSDDGLRSVHSSTVPSRGVIPIACGSKTLPLIRAVNAVPVPKANVKVRLRAIWRPEIGRVAVGSRRGSASRSRRLPRTVTVASRFPGSSSKPSSYGRDRRP